MDANAITWCFSASRMTPSFLRYNIWNALLQDKLETNRKAVVTLDVNIAFFLNNFWKIQVSSTWPNRMLEFCLKILSPGPWAYFYELSRTKLDLEQEAASTPGSGSWSNIHDLVKNNNAINVNSIDWRKKDQIRLAIERGRRIVEIYEESQKDFTYMDDSGNFY